MEKRVKFVYMEESFTGKSFGYDAKILAHCIKELLPPEVLPGPVAAMAVAPEQTDPVNSQAVIGLDDMLSQKSDQPALKLPQPAVDAKHESLRRRSAAAAIKPPAVKKQRRYNFTQSQQRLSQYAD